MKLRRPLFRPAHGQVDDRALLALDQLERLVEGESPCRAPVDRDDDVAGPDPAWRAGPRSAEVTMSPALRRLDGEPDAGVAPAPCGS